LTETAAQTEDGLAACFREVRALFSQRGLNPVRVADAPKGWLGVQVQGAMTIWTVDIDCGEKFLTRLPFVTLRPPRPLLAHVGYAGAVCIDDAQGMSLDTERWPELVAYTVLAAFDVLERSAADAATGLVEFYNELEGYWLGLPDSRRSRASVEVDGKDRLVSVYVDAKQKIPKWYFTERGTPAPPEFLIKDLIVAAR
jgi:hypothetical protein